MTLDRGSMRDVPSPYYSIPPEIPVEMTLAKDRPTDTAKLL